MKANKETKITGTIKGTRSRYGFLKSNNTKDYFIPPQEMDKVFCGDVVEATIYHKDEENYTISINKVIKSNKKNLIGVFVEDETGMYVIPDEYGFNRKIRIPKSFKNKARKNHYVKVEIIEHPFKNKRPKAKVVEVIGDKNSWYIQADYNLSKYNIPSYISEDLNVFCSKFIKLNNLNEKVNKLKRKDLTKLDFFTIDGENTVDIDDAVYVQRLKDKWKLLVAISDVSEFIKENDTIDNDAYNRTSTVYLVGKTIPMLPSELTDLLSLKPLEKRLVVVADITINLDGSIDKYSFYEAVIQSKAKLSYGEVDNFIESGTLDIFYSKIKEPLSNLKELHYTLNNYRKNNNILPANRVDYKNFLDFNRKIESVEILSMNKSHKMIEEAMLCANKCASDFISRYYNEGIYKTQNGILNNKINSLFYFLSDYIELDKNELIDFNGFKEIMHRIEKNKNNSYLKSVISLFLENSDFSSSPKPHYSMGFDNYTYFTSPIRRYTDIIVHRMIKSKIKNKKYKINKENYINHFKSKLNKIEKCIKHTEKWMQADYLRSLDKEKFFEAKIIDINNRFISVKLVDFGIEGIINISDKEHIKTSNLMIEVNNKKFKILDKLNVKVKKINPEDHSVVFEI